MVNKKDSKTKITPFQEEQLKAAKRVKEYKLSCEANVVSIFYKNPELLYNSKIFQKMLGESITRSLMIL